MLSCTYYGGLSDKPITEYLPVLHDGYAGEKAIKVMTQIIHSAKLDSFDADRALGFEEDLDCLAEYLSTGNPPSSIEYRLDGKFYRVIKRSWA